MRTVDTKHVDKTRKDASSNNQAFLKACADAHVRATKRQLRRFTQKRGRAYRAYVGDPLPADPRCPTYV